jgi:hypothetical protein
MKEQLSLSEKASGGMCRKISGENIRNGRLQMETRPINRKVHDILISKGYSWKPKVHVDMYQKDDTLIFIYMRDYAIMLINGKIATQKEFIDETEYVGI